MADTGPDEQPREEIAYWQAYDEYVRAEREFARLAKAAGIDVNELDTKGRSYEQMTALPAGVLEEGMWRELTRHRAKIRLSMAIHALRNHGLSADAIAARLKAPESAVAAYLAKPMETMPDAVRTQTRSTTRENVRQIRSGHRAEEPESEACGHIARLAEVLACAVRIVERLPKKKDVKKTVAKQRAALYEAAKSSGATVDELLAEADRLIEAAERAGRLPRHAAREILAMSYPEFLEQIFLPFLYDGSDAEEVRHPYTPRPSEN